MIHEFITTQGKGEFSTIRHLEFNVPAKEVAKLDNSTAINYYAALFVAETFQHESLNEAAERVAGLEKDPSAKMRFKAAVRKLRREK